MPSYDYRTSVTRCVFVWRRYNAWRPEELWRFWFDLSFYCIRFKGDWTSLIGNDFNGSSDLQATLDSRGCNFCVDLPARSANFAWDSATPKTRTKMTTIISCIMIDLFLTLTDDFFYKDHLLPPKKKRWCRQWWHSIQFRHSKKQEVVLRETDYQERSLVLAGRHRVFRRSA